MSDRDFTDLLEGESESRTGSSTSRVSGWRRIFRGNRVLWIVAAVAVLCLVVGLLVGRFVISPADAAANAEGPDAGLITVPVEFGELSNDVTLRGDIGYADPVEVTIDAGQVDGPAVVTGQVPEVGAVLSPLSIALEVVGRPVIVLPGELPAYRTLRVGVSGPDVQQFKQAVASVGIDGGDPADPAFTTQTAAAVTALYERVGYPAPAGDEASVEAVNAAREGVTSAQQSIASAESELGRVASGPSRVDIVQADNAVASARRALAAAEAAQPPDQNEIADLRDALNLAIAQREALSASVDTTSQRAAVDAAHQQLTAAQETLAEAERNALPALTPSEVLFLDQLPRRVDDVTVSRGTILSGAAMTVSGADVQISAAAADADATLLAVDDEASFELPDGTAATAKITELTPPGEGEGDAADGSRWSLTLVPNDLTPEQITQLQGQNVRVSIPVGATKGEVLAVPFAALTAGQGGESRVEVVEGDPREGEDATTRLVTVTTGLAAEGLVEVSPVDGELTEGDLVVVGE